MLLISLTAAQRSRFLTRVPCVRFHIWGCGEVQGRRDEVRCRWPFTFKLIFFFMCVFFMLGPVGRMWDVGRWGMSARSRVLLGGCVHALPEAHTLFMGESRPSLARKAAEGVLKVQRSPVSEVVHWCWVDRGYWGRRAALEWFLSEATTGISLNEAVHLKFES